MKEIKHLSCDSCDNTRLYLQNKHIASVFKTQGNFETVSGNKFKITGVEKNINNELVAFTGIVFIDRKADEKASMKWNGNGQALLDAFHFDKNQFNLVIKEFVTF